MGSLHMSSNEQSELSELDQYIQERMNAAALPGLACGIIADGQLLWAKGYGFAHIARKAPVLPTTRFKLASLSKFVTAAAVVKAAESGMIDLDADINRYLPFRVQHPAHPKKIITTRMLLSHTSGICDNDAVFQQLYTYGEPPLRLIQVLWDYLCPNGRFYNATLNYGTHGPGEAFEFCSIGMSLAALVVERVSGQPFDGYSQRQVLLPLGMHHAYWKTTDELDDVAMPYRFRRFSGYETCGYYAMPNYPDGGLHASLVELVPLFSLLAAAENPVLNPQSTQSLREAHFPDAAPGVGLGCYWEERDGTALLGHAGADDGVATRFFYYPVENVGIITLANGEPTTKGRWALLAIERALFEASPALIAAAESSAVAENDETPQVVPFPKRHAS